MSPNVTPAQLVIQDNDGGGRGRGKGGGDDETYKNVRTSATLPTTWPLAVPTRFFTTRFRSSTTPPARRKRCPSSPNPRARRGHGRSGRDAPSPTVSASSTRPRL